MRATVELMEQGLDGGGFLRADEVGLVEDDDIGEFHLIREEIGDGAFVLFAEGLTGILERLAFLPLAAEVQGIDDRDHGVEARHGVQTLTMFIGEGEGLRDRERLADAGGLDEEIVEAPSSGEPRDFDEEVLTQRAADAAVAHFHHFFFGAGEGSIAGLHHLSVHIDLAHVIDDDGYFAAFAVAEDVVEQGGFAGAKEAGEDGDWKFFVQEHKSLMQLICVTQLVCINVELSRLRFGPVD